MRQAECVYIYVEGSMVTQRAERFGYITKTENLTAQGSQPPNKCPLCPTWLPGLCSYAAANKQPGDPQGRSFTYHTHKAAIGQLT